MRVDSFIYTDYFNGWLGAPEQNVKLGKSLSKSRQSMESVHAYSLNVLVGRFPYPVHVVLISSEKLPKKFKQY